MLLNVVTTVNVCVLIFFIGRELRQHHVKLNREKKEMQAKVHLHIKFDFLGTGSVHMYMAKA